MRTYLTNACNQRSVFLNIQLVMIEPLEEATMQPVTIAKMISLDDPTPVMLPKNFVDETVGEAKSAILILAPLYQILRVIPTQNRTGIKIIIDIENFSPDFLLEFNHILSSHNIKALHNTGLCFTLEHCIYEGYFDLSELPISKAQLIEELSAIQGVSKVEISQIE